MGSENGFLTKRLKGYSVDRNNPCNPNALSGLSPYLHFGQISAQRCAFEARKLRNSHPQVCLLALHLILSVSRCSFLPQNCDNRQTLKHLILMFSIISCF